MTALLSVNQATLGHGAHPVLRDVSFQLQAGTATCLLGANGSGKTTLLRTLLGGLPLLKGSVLLEGSPISQLSDKARARALAWVPQAHDGAFAFSVLEMVMMGLTAHMGLFAVPGARQRAAATQQLAELGISHLATQRWDLLSGGERQLVLIARALAQQPRVLLLDEPAASLDFGHQIALLDTLTTLKQRGMTLLMATHHPLHARALADSVICIEADGQVSQDAPERQLHADKLAAMYRVAPAQIQHHLYGNPQ